MKLIKLTTLDIFYAGLYILFMQALFSDDLHRPTFKANNT